MPKFKESQITRHKKNKILSVKKELKSIAIDPGKEIISSFCLPIYNYYRLKYAKRYLQTKNISVSLYDIAFLCLKYFMKRIFREKPQLARACKRNNADCSFKKVSCRMDPSEYNSFIMKKTHVKVSLSFLLDLAIRKNLQFVIQLLLNHYASEKKNNRLEKLRSLCSSYYKKILENSYANLILEENLCMPLRI